MYSDHVPEALRAGFNRQVLGYLGCKNCHSHLIEAVDNIIASTCLGKCATAQGYDFPWAVWHVNGAIFAYACGQHEVGYLVETTDSDHPAGPHWEVQSLYDPSENLERNLKNALCLVCWD